MSSRVRWSVLAVVVLVLSTLAWPDHLFTPTHDPLAGSAVFGAKGCSRCHSVEGVGGKIGPDLGRIPNVRSFYDLAAAMWNHLPRMVDQMRQLGVARPRLDPTETGNLIAFLFTLDYFDPPGDTEAGKRLFLEKQCVVCHQVAGTGGVVGPDLDSLGVYGSPIFVAAAMWNHGPQMTEAMTARKLERPTFEGSDLLDLIAYIKSVSRLAGTKPLYVLPGRVSEGQRLFVDKGCIRCHRIGGHGGEVGSDLVERGARLSLTQFATAMWNKAPAMVEAMRERGIVIPPVHAEDMADLVAYLYTVRYFAGPADPVKGRQLVGDKGCLDCHSVNGQGGTLAGDLGRSESFDSPASVITALWNHSVVTGPQPDGQSRAWPALSAEEMAELVSFLETLGRTR